MIMLVNYYLIEKDFRQDYKSANTLYNNLQKDLERLNYGILQSALFAYYNQDAIAKDRSNIRQTSQLLMQ